VAVIHRYDQLPDGVCHSLTVNLQGKVFDLDRMLHRDQRNKIDAPVVKESLRTRWQQFVGISDQFSKTDKVLALALVGWTSSIFSFFMVVTVANLIHPFPNEWWARLWKSFIWIYFTKSVPTTIWFTIGGISDIRALFKTLATAVRDNTDDGRVLQEAQLVPSSCATPEVRSEQPDVELSH